MAPKNYNLENITSDQSVLRTSLFPFKLMTLASGEDPCQWGGPSATFSP